MAIQHPTMEDSKHDCPVCYYGIEGNVEDKYQEICPCCGTQFGYDDATTPHSVLRDRWISKGMKWFSKNKPPENWDPVKQINKDS